MTPELQQVAARRRANVLTALILAGLGGLATLGWHYGRDPLSLALAVALALLCALPLIRFQRRPDRIPTIPALAGVYAIYYSLPVFLRPELTVKLEPLDPHAIQTALWGALVGWIAIALGTAVPLPRFLRGSFAGSAPSPRRSWVFGVILVALYLCVDPFVDSAPSAIRHVLAVLHLGGPVGFFLLARADVSKAGIPRALRVLAWLALFPLSLVSGIARGLLFPALLLGLGALLGRWRRSGRIPWALVAASAAALVVLQSAKMTFRDLTWGGHLENLDVFSKAELFARLAVTSVGQQNDSTEAAKERTDALTTLAYVMDHTPFPVPFWNGESYSTAAWVLVPRMFYPLKPVAVLGGEFGHRYDLLDYSDQTTSYNFPQLVEAYANFGWPGIVLIMFAIGMLYGIAERLFNNRTAGVGGEILTMVCLLGFVAMEGDTAGMLGGVVQAVIVYWPIARVISGWSFRANEDSKLRLGLPHPEV